MTKQQVLDLYFLDARHKLTEIAAFLDRIERADGPSSPSASMRQAKEDFRLKAFRDALDKLTGNKRKKAKNVLLAFSDLTIEPISKATTKAACGAFPK
jgi:hypothetical protein